MPVTKIPKLFKTEIVDINGTEIELKGYRGNDYTILRLLNKLANETVGINVRFKRIIKNKNDDELTDEELSEAIKVRSEIEDIEEQMQPLISKLGQRGIKRAFNPTLNTEKIDKIPDVEIEYAFLKKIYKLMGDLSAPSSTDEGTGKKPEKEV